MNKPSFLILIVVFIFPSFLAAQTTDRKGQRWQTGSTFAANATILPADNTTSARVLFSYNRHVSRKLTLGAGIGFTYYNDPVSLLPVFLDIQYALGRGPAIPYVAIKSGYGFSILTDTDVPVDDHDGGFMINPSAGIKFPTPYNFSLDLHAGFNLDHAFIEVEERADQTLRTDITYKRFSIGMAVAF